MVKKIKDSFVAADIPGLIEGAHKGKGLGDEFLKHIARTKVLIHIIDVNEKDSDGLTALMITSRRGDIDGIG